MPYKSLFTIFYSFKISPLFYAPLISHFSKPGLCYYERALALPFLFCTHLPLIADTPLADKRGVGNDTPLVGKRDDGSKPSPPCLLLCRLLLPHLSTHLLAAPGHGSATDQQFVMATVPLFIQAKLGNKIKHSYNWNFLKQITVNKINFSKSKWN